MDNRTLVIVGLVVSFLEAVTLLFLAFYRKERAITYFAAGFVASVLGALLLLGQGHFTPWITILLANLLIIGWTFSLAVGFRDFSGMKVVCPRRFWVYLGVFVVLFTSWTFVWNSYLLRAVTFAAMTLVLYTEILLLFVRRSFEVPSFVRRIARVMSVSLILAQVVRIVLVLVFHSSAPLLLDDPVVTPFTILNMLVSGILWSNLILVADSTRLVEEMQLKNRQLESLAHTDELTGLFNRNAFEQLVLDGPAYERRRSEPTCILLLDLDHFKRINDTHGHKAGDAALVRTAERIRGMVRQDDRIYRWGGEEFLVLAQDTTLEAASGLAERIRTAVGTTEDPLHGSISVSIGVAERVPGEDKDAWFRRADLALYRAKKLGRDRVISSEKST